MAVIGFILIATPIIVATIVICASVLGHLGVRV